MYRATPYISLCLLLACRLLQGQVIEEHVDFDRPEAWAMAYFTAAGLMQGNEPPQSLQPGQWALGFDVSNIPELSREERTVGFNGIKEENMNKAPFIARPLLHYGITNRVSLTASYVPPVEIFDRLETHLAALYVNWKVWSGESFYLNLRGGGQWSEAKGDFTCPAEIAGIMDPEINPYGCEEPSHDTFLSLTGTVELTAGYHLPTKWPISTYLSAAYTYADLEFKVDAHWAGGVEDRRQLYADGGIWTFGAGLKAEVTDRIHASLTLVHAPLDVRRPPDYGVENDSLTYVRLAVHLLL